MKSEQGLVKWREAEVFKLANATATSIATAQSEFNEKKIEYVNDLADRLSELSSFSDMSAFMLAMNGIVAYRSETPVPGPQPAYEELEDRFSYSAGRRLFAIEGAGLRRPDRVYLGNYPLEATPHESTRWSDGDVNGLRYRIEKRSSYDDSAEYIGKIVVPTVCLDFRFRELEDAVIKEEDCVAAVVRRQSDWYEADISVVKNISFRADIADWAKGRSPAKYASEVADIAKAEELLIEYADGK